MLLKNFIKIFQKHTTSDYNMTTNELSALSFITSVAAEELPIVKWIAILNSIYKDGIPEETTMATAINYYVERFPEFKERADDYSPESYDKLYDDFLTFVFNEINKK